MQVPFLMQKHLYAKHLPRIAILKAVCRFFVLLFSTFCSFSIFVAGFFFAFGNFAHQFFVLFNAPLNDRDKKKKKRVCNGFLVPGNLGAQSVALGGPVVLLVYGSRRRDNLLAWGKLFANPYELKSHTRVWEKYNHFERIYSVQIKPIFDKFLQNILGIMTNESVSGNFDI